MAVSVAKKTRRPIFLTRQIEEDGEALRADVITAWDSFQEALHTNDKDYMRTQHIHAKSIDASDKGKSLLKLLEKRKNYFKLGCSIDPDKIQPMLILVEAGSHWEDVFKICRGYWSMPYSKGYGRRLRFVVFDEFHESVIGILGLQSPPADLACRDELFDFPKGRKLDFINCMLDAYTVGAVPPYSNLLGGKLIASLLASDSIRQAYWRVYGHKKTVILGKRLPQPLLAITTTSAFGRSSIYNRLKYQNRLLAEPIGYTKGYGTIHLESVYSRITNWLSLQDELIPGGFGHGPKVRWQNIQIALNRLNLPPQYLEHGLKREAFLFRHVENLCDVCSASAIPIPINCQASGLIDHWKERWAIPRSKRDPTWNTVDPIAYIKDAITKMITS